MKTTIHTDHPSFRAKYFKTHVPGAFTTLATHLLPTKSGEPSCYLYGLSEHLERLSTNCSQLGFFNTQADRDSWSSSIDEIKTNILGILQQHPSVRNSQLAVRIVKTATEIALCVSEYKNPWHNRKIEAISYAASRTAPEIKSTAYQVCQLARAAAEKAGADEALLVSNDGTITEGAWSNIFWVTKNGEFYTNTSSSLLGVTQRKLLELSNCKIGTLKVSDLASVDELFVTQSTSLITCVNKVNNFQLSSFSRSEECRSLLVNDILKTGERVI